MKKKILLVGLFFLFTLLTLRTASAQQGFNPEYLGNAGAPVKTGFALKTFQSYYYQNRPKANDVETTFETQFYTKGFMNDIEKDMFQWALHLPIGYRRVNAVAGPDRQITGIGNFDIIIEYYHNLINNGDTTWWFDNGLTTGFPTSTFNNGMRIGNNAYSLTWFQENFFQHKSFMMTLMPIAVNWTFEDEKTNTRDGLSLTVMNGTAGYKITEKFHFGVDFGLLLGRVLGSDNGAGGSLSKVVRAYAGPGGLVSFTPTTALQFCGVIDFVTRNTDRGQGIFLVLFHMF